MGKKIKKTYVIVCMVAIVVLANIFLMYKFVFAKSRDDVKKMSTSLKVKSNSTLSGDASSDTDVNEYTIYDIDYDNYENVEEDNDKNLPLSEEEKELYYASERVTKDRLDKLSLEGYDKLMLVAHPDDETLWAGGHLIKDKYFVVCFTHGREDDVRCTEFNRVMKYTGSRSLMLNHPDKIGDERSDWGYIENELKEDIDCLINYKKWDCVVTHNLEGEYGHQHHKTLNKVTTEIYNENDINSKLFFFGKYYEAEEKDMLDKMNLERIDADTLSEKKEALKIYKSQDHGVNYLFHRHGQMYPYENFQEYKK